MRWPVNASYVDMVSLDAYDGIGGDDTYFMTQMAAWIKANATGPVIFWNYGGGTLPLNIPNYTSGDTQDATAVFKSAFSAGI